MPLHIYSAFQSSKNPDLLLKSFQKYLSSDCDIQRTSYEMIATQNDIELRYFAAKDSQLNLLLVPSIINGSEIFDLTEDVSFIKFLQKNNVSVYMIDWGNLNQNFDGGLNDLQEILQKFISTSYKHAGDAIHILGYCLGGSILASVLQKLSVQDLEIGSLTLLAAPLDFDVQSSSWEYVLKNPEIIKNQIKIQSGLNQRMMQSHFMSLKPDYIEQKFKSFLGMQKKSLEERRFVAVERWLNEGNDLPLVLSLDIINCFFIENAAQEAIEKRPDIPLITIISNKDQIVPFESADILSEKTDYRIISNCGHVGMMVGSDAEKTVWQPFTEYIKTIASQQK